MLPTEELMPSTNSLHTPHKCACCWSWQVKVLPLLSRVQSLFISPREPNNWFHEWREQPRLSAASFWRAALRLNIRGCSAGIRKCWLLYVPNCTCVFVARQEISLELTTVSLFEWASSLVSPWIKKIHFEENPCLPLFLIFSATS
jgi:hypothetical protein